MNQEWTVYELAKMIDHSLLHPTMTDAEIRAGCELSLRFDVAAACVKPYSVPTAAEILKDPDVKVCSVIGFPHGNSTTAIKVEETKQAIRDGAPEIDMVINIGKAIGGEWEYVSSEITAVNEACRSQDAILKVIFENDYLQDEQIIRLCEICTQIQVAFVKTSTGYGFVKGGHGLYSYAGATDPHLRLMRAHCPPEMQIKAAGGVRTLDDLLRVRALGVSRVGATATAAILEEASRRSSEAAQQVAG